MKNRKGLTLIEVILSIAIIGIILVPLSGIFNTGLRNIVSAGDRTEDIYALQEAMDNAINASNLTEPLSKEEDKTITLKNGENARISEEIVLDKTIDSDVFTKTISGKLITVEIEGTNKILTTFVPVKANQE